MSGAERARRSTTPVRLAAFVVALALACVSAAFSIDGLTAIFAGAFWPIIIMGAVLEAGKQVAAAWLTEHWTSAPSLLRLMEALRGEVVLVQFWTYFCINCLRTLPYITKWYEKYKDKGFVVVGVHTPEFAFEKERANVETAIKRFGITYPVAQDNQYRAWQAFGNEYWPADYLIDKSGKIVATQFGEGSYQQLEDTIARLVGDRVPMAQAADPDLSAIATPELYLGSEKNDGAMVDSQNSAVGERSYALPESVPQNRFALSGTWSLAADRATSSADGGEILLRFNAPKVNLVAGSASSTSSRWASTTCSTRLRRWSRDTDLLSCITR